MLGLRYTTVFQCRCIVGRQHRKLRVQTAFSGDQVTKHLEQMADTCSPRPELFPSALDEGDAVSNSRQTPGVLLTSKEQKKQS
ncbi:hypothetical protein RRG08_063816 [Elysia crispata]|uniref:Uncharacterized protein n=1 Tax=Elysia crispata TaxID=231223 RepID=A0AAE1D070_9GAST|nr:hypothetical protein RRG08_063816 [Elysia crispata]